LDYSIIDINEQSLKNIEHIRETFNNEFEWDGPLMAFQELKTWLASCMKWKRSKLKKSCGFYDPLHVPPTYIKTCEWENWKLVQSTNKKSIEKTSMSSLPPFIYKFCCLLGCNYPFSRVLILISWLGWCALWEVNDLSSRPCPSR
jgi:hypothetical protein